MPVCTPVPRLRVTHQPVAPADPRYGLFAAAVIVEDMDPHAFHGVEYVAVCDPGVVAQPIGECGPDAEPTPDKIASRSREIAEADAFAVYAAEACLPGGRTTEQDQAELRARIVSGERHTVEQAIYEGLAGARPALRHPDTRVLADGEALDLPTAVGLLEHTLAVTGHTGIIHTPRWTGPVMDHLRIAHRDGPRMRTLLGNAVAFGSGYSGAPPEGAEDDGALWLYATPQITIRRSDIITPAGWENGAFDPSTNTGLLLAERVYVVDWPCQAVAVKTTLQRLDVVPPPGPPPNPAVAVSPASGDAPLEVEVTVTGFRAPVIIDFGDGTAPETAPDGATVSHTYTEAGTYTVTATSVENPEVTAAVPVTVEEPPPPPDPVVTAAPASGVAPLEVTITVDNHGNGSTTVDFGDGSEPAVVEDGANTTHTYTAPGSFAVSAASQADPSAVGETTVEVAEPPAPVVTATPAAGEAPLEVELVVDNHGHGPVDVDFGDNTPVGTNPGDGETATAYTYEAAGTYTATAASQAYPDATGTAQVEVSEPAPPPAPVVTATPDSGDAPLDVQVAVDNHGNGPTTLDFGDASEEQTVADGATVPHTYAAAGTYTLTATSQAGPSAVGTATVTVTEAPPEG